MKRRQSEPKVWIFDNVDIEVWAHDRSWSAWVNLPAGTIDTKTVRRGREPVPTDSEVVETVRGNIRRWMEAWHVE